MIVIVDYQMGNLRSVQKAVERVGGEIQVSSDPRAVAQAEKLILPGVGAFRDAIRELRQRQLVAPILDAIAADKPMLGICLGLQLLFEVSFEGGTHEGLGVLPGEVRRFSTRELKVPHMGWNETYGVRATPLLDGIASGTHFYYVHSYYVVPRDREVVVAEAHYPEPFCAMVQRGNLYATQFHPEKSQAAGQQLLRRFVELPLVRPERLCNI